MSSQAIQLPVSKPKTKNHNLLKSLNSFSAGHLGGPHERPIPRPSPERCPPFSYSNTAPPCSNAAAIVCDGSGCGAVCMADAHHGNSVTVARERSYGTRGPAFGAALVGG